MPLFMDVHHHVEGLTADAVAGGERGSGGGGGGGTR